MKRFLAFAIVLASVTGLHAQVKDADVCDIIKDPVAFNGKIVRVKGTVAASLDQFVVKGANCGFPIDAVWLSYPEGTKGKAGPTVLVQLQPARNFAGTLPQSSARR